MLPFLNNPDRDFQAQPHREEVNVAAPNIPRADTQHKNSIFNNISATIATSPKFFAQESLVKTLGNNMFSQGIMQVGSILGEAIDRLVGTSEPVPVSNGSSGPGLSELDRSVLREMLRTLLRIEDNTASAPVGFFQPEQQKTVFKPAQSGKFDKIDYKPTTGPKTTSTQQTPPVVNEGRKSAEDVLTRLNQKNPISQQGDPTSNILREHYGDIEQNIANTAAMGVYNVLGYNVLSQGIVDTASLVGDLTSRLLTKSGSPSAPPQQQGGQPVDYTSKSSKDLFEKIIGKKTEDLDSVEKKEPSIGKPVDYTSKSSKELFDKVTGSDKVVDEIKESNSILHTMLDGINQLTEITQEFYGKQEVPVSTIENELESKQKQPISEKLQDGASKGATAAAATPVDQPARESILSKLGSAAEILQSGADLLGGGDKAGGKGILGKLSSLTRFLPSVGTIATVGAAAAPLAIMGYAAHKAGDQTNDIENVEGMKETSEGLAGFLKKIGLDFGDRFEKQAAKNREGLDTTAELEAMKKPSASTALEKTADTAADAEKRRQSVFGEGLKQQISNITNINSQTVIPSRTPVRNTDSTANRYFDQAMN